MRNHQRKTENKRETRANEYSREAIRSTKEEEARRSRQRVFGNSDLMPRPPQQQRVVQKVGTAVPRIMVEMPVMRRFYEPPLAISKQRAIAFVEAQLGEPMREDGPILGMEFDPLPPGAFGAPIGILLDPI
ncbi:unnamed protein product [Fraxinus pennsylvanica]|uniref:Uncharacterized protein n=1 Tax=Fraxinus pennsylvanica TaxID=56036 RepID=A0AAD2EEK2_9LAMI|nr:unnamed protein product [Fraxinus pennsylvanica]